MTQGPMSQQQLAQLAALTVSDKLTLKSTGKRVSFTCGHVFRVEEQATGGCKIFIVHPTAHQLDVCEDYDTVLREIGWVEDSGIVEAHGAMPNLRP